MLCLESLGQMILEVPSNLIFYDAMIVFSLFCSDFSVTIPDHVSSSEATPRVTLMKLICAAPWLCTAGSSFPAPQQPIDLVYYQRFAADPISSTVAFSVF